MLAEILFVYECKNIVDIDTYINIKYSRKFKNFQGVLLEWCECEYDAYSYLMKLCAHVVGDIWYIFGYYFVWLNWEVEKMAKKITGYVKLQINAGKATPAPPVGPALGQHGVNIMGFCKELMKRQQKMLD